MSKPKAIICPSLLSCDFAKLAEESHRMLQDGADWLHLDIMDGHFVPNLTIGPPIVKCLRKHTDAFLDCHCMVSDPARWIEPLAAAGASQMTFHIEIPKNEDELKSILEQITSSGMKAGIAVKPKTPIEDVLKNVQKFREMVSMVLIMTVEPGFGGQKFMEDMMPKVEALRKHLPDLNIQVDGGIAPSNIDIVGAAGANVIVAGSSIFNAPDPAEAIAQLRRGIDQ